VEDALQSQHVVIVGGPAGVSAQEEARLRGAGVDVHRLEGKDEAETQRMLDELVARATPWPGAPPQSGNTAPDATLETFESPAAPVFPDAWTVPDAWLGSSLITRHDAPTAADAPSKVFVPQPAAEGGEVDE